MAAFLVTIAWVIMLIVVYKMDEYDE